MIHSMSGGILSDPGTYTFVKVTADGETVGRWYISDLELTEGDRVKIPLGAANTVVEGTVVRVEKNVDGRVTPVPLKRAKRIIARV